MKTPETKARTARSDETQPEGYTGEYIGYYCPLVTDGLKLLNPRLSPHVTKHTCYSRTPAVLIMSIIAEKCCPMRSVNLQVQQKHNKPINQGTPAQNSCVILLSESHITSKQEGIIGDNLDMSGLNMLNI